MANKIIPGDDEAIFFASAPAAEAHHFGRKTIGTHAHNSMDGRSRTQWLLLALFSLVCSTHGHTLRTGASRFSFRLLLPFGIDQTQPSFCLSPSILPPTTTVKEGREKRRRNAGPKKSISLPLPPSQWGVRTQKPRALSSWLILWGTKMTAMSSNLVIWAPCL